MRVVLTIAFVERAGGCANHHVVCGAGLRDAAEVFRSHAVRAAVELRLRKRLLGVFDALFHEFFVVKHRGARAAEGRRSRAAVGLRDAACDFGDALFRELFSLADCGIALPASPALNAPQVMTSSLMGEISRARIS
mgnify:CR=1 FL=1